MQLKLNRRYNIIILGFLAVLLLAIIYLTINNASWSNRRVEVIILIIVISTLFLIWFKWYENNCDKHIINKMVKEGHVALAYIKDGKFERIIKDSNNRKYPVWRMVVDVYDKDLNKKELVMYDKFNTSQTKMPKGYIYVTYDPNDEERMFVVPNMLLGTYDGAEELVTKYEHNIADIRYLNAYFMQGMVIETYKKSLNKAKEVDMENEE